MVTSRTRLVKSRRPGTLSNNRHVLTAVICGVVATAAGINSASAGTFTWNKISPDASYNWTTAANWTPTAPATGVPNAIGDVANVTANITTNGIIVNLDSPVTVGILNVGDGSNIYTISGTGPLTFNNGASASQLNMTSQPLASGHVITTDIRMAGDLNLSMVAPGSTNATATGLTLNGTIQSSAGSGLQTLAVTSALAEQNRSGFENLTINSIISDGSAQIALTQKTGTGTSNGITTLTGANTYSGGTLVVVGAIKGTQNSGTPFGTGSLTLQGGRLSLAPSGTGAAVSLTGATLAPSSTLTYAGGGFFDLNKGTQTSLTFTVGNAGAASNSVLVRQNFGTLILSPAAIANLGTTERLIVNQGVAMTNALDGSKAIVNPTVVAASAASTVGDFLIHDTTNGFQVATGLYTARSGAVGALVTGEISNVTAAATNASGNPYAIRLGSTLAINGSLTVGSGSGQAGVIMNTGSGISGGTLQFGGAEGSIYMGAAASITSQITGSAGVTKFGTSTLTLSNTTNSFSGNIRVNNGTLAIGSGPGSLGATNNNIILMPQTTFDIAASALNGTTIPQNIILNGGRSVTTSNYNVDEAQITSNGANIGEARLLSGTISSGALAQTTAPGGMTIRNGYTRLSGNNDFTGSLRLWNAVVIADSNTAFGLSNGTRAAGIATYITSTLGIRGGVTITNENVELFGSAPATGLAQMHAFSGGSGNVAEWTGNVELGTTTTFGADANTTLRLSGPVISNSNGVRKSIGLGTVEISSANTNGNSTSANSLAFVSNGTLRLSNITGSATGLSPIEVLTGATLDGNGSASGNVMVRNGAFLKPGTSIGTFTVAGGGNTAGQSWIASAAIGLSGSLTAEAASHLVLEMNSTAADKLQLTAANVLTTASLAAPVEFLVDPTFNPLVPTTFDLVTARTITYQGGLVGDLALSADNLDEQLAAISPSFTRVTTTPTNPYEYRYQLISNDTANTDILRVEFAAVGVPEPTSLAILAAGGLGLLARRRRSL